MVKEKSLAFAIRIVNLCKHFVEVKREYVLSKQLLRSGTSVGAMIREAEHAQSKADFLSKMNIALKEANEAMYWLLLLRETDYLPQLDFASLNADAGELVRMLAKIVKTTKAGLGRQY